MENPYCSCKLTPTRPSTPSGRWLTAAIPVDNPYCSCKLTRVRSRCQTCIEQSCRHSSATTAVAALDALEALAAADTAGGDLCLRFIALLPEEVDAVRGHALQLGLRPKPPPPGTTSGGGSSSGGGGGCCWDGSRGSVGGSLEGGGGGGSGSVELVVATQRHPLQAAVADVGPLKPARDFWFANAVPGGAAPTHQPQAGGDRLGADPSGKRDDWACTLCGYTNFVRRATCRNCSLPTGHPNQDQLEMLAADEAQRTAEQDVLRAGERRWAEFYALDRPAARRVAGLARFSELPEGVSKIGDGFKLGGDDDVEDEDESPQGTSNTNKKQKRVEPTPCPPASALMNLWKVASLPHPC